MKDSFLEISDATIEDSVSSNKEYSMNMNQGSSDNARLCRLNIRVLYVTRECATDYEKWIESAAINRCGVALVVTCRKIIFCTGLSIRRVRVLMDGMYK